MLFNPAGKFRVFKDVQNLNAEFPMLVNPADKFRAAKDLHSENAESPMDLTQSGMVTELPFPI